MKYKNPKTPEEWQRAVDGAAAVRQIADMKMYGLAEGGPEINIARCDELLEWGRTRGHLPDKDAVDGIILALFYPLSEDADAKP